MSKGKIILKRTLKVLAYFLLALAGTIISLWIFINSDYGKNYIRKEAQQYLRKKLNTNVEIGKLDYDIPNGLQLGHIYIEDKNKDTLLFAGTIDVKIKMLDLLSGQVNASKIILSDIYANTYSTKDKADFNYQFIIDAFSDDKPERKKSSANQSESLKINIGNIELNNIRVKYKDVYGGTEMAAAIGKSQIDFKKIDLEKPVFDINDFSADRLSVNMQTYKTNINQEAVAASNVESDLPFINLKHLSLDNSHIVINDSINSMFFSNALHQLTINELSLDLNKQIVKNKSVHIDSTNIVFNHTQDTTTTSDPTTSKPWIFCSENITISRSYLTYNDNDAPEVSGFDVSHIDAKGINTAVNNIYFGEDTLSFLVSQFTMKEKSGLGLDTTHVNFSMNKNSISAKDIYIKTPNSLIQRSFDYSFVDIDDIINNPKNSQFNLSLYKSYISAKDLSILNPDLNKLLPPAFFQADKINFTAEANGNLNKINLTDFQFKGLNGSRLAAKATFYNLLDSQKLAYDLNILNSNFLKKDLAMFVPAAHQQSLKDLPDNFSLSGKIKGDMKNVKADILTKAPGFEYSGTIAANNFDNPSAMKFDVNTKSFSLNTGMIRSYIPDEIREQLFIPSNISAKGILKGNSENIITDMLISSSLGSLAMKGYVYKMNNPNKADYDLLLSTPGFMLGKLLKQDTMLGKINGSFTAKGKGFDYKTMVSTIKGNIKEFEYNTYNYQNINLEAALNNGLITTSGRIDDRYLTLNYHSNLDVRKEFPIVDARIKVDTAQLHELRLISDTLNFSGTITCNGRNLTPHQLDAGLQFDNFHLSTGSAYYPVYETYLKASSNQGIDSVVLTAPFATINAGGNFDYTEIAFVILQYFNKYFSIPMYDTPTITSHQFLGINGRLVQDSIITTLLPPGLKFKDIIFDGNFDNDTNNPILTFNLNAPHIDFEDKEIKDFNFVLGNSAESINAKIAFDTLQLGDYIVHKTKLEADIADNKIDLDAVMKDEVDKDWFGLSATAMQEKDGYIFHLTDDVLLNYEKWNTTDDNSIAVTTDGFYIHNFLISNDSSLIYMNSEKDEAKSPIAIDIDNFSLKSIGGMVSTDSDFVSGIVDVKLVVGDLDEPMPSFTGTANIEGLGFMGYPIGNLSGKAEKISNNEIGANISLNENENDLKLTANYFIDDTAKEFEVNVFINKLNMKTIEAFSDGQLTACKGNIHGGILITGTTSNYEWDGNLFFDSVCFKSTMLGTTYKINNQKIVLSYPKIILSNIQITDSLNHLLTINGNMNMQENKELGLALRVNAKEFVLLNSRRTPESEFYGYASASLKLLINGTLSKPNIEGDIMVNDKSDVTIVLPDGGYVKDDGNTVVRFVDRDTFLLGNHAEGFVQPVEAEPDFTTFLKYNLNLGVSKNASLKIIIDPSTGDEIKVQGDAHLNALSDPGGNIMITGNYELSKGYYNLNYQLLKRQFNLLNGSNINFAGPVDDAIMDISAEYVSNAAPYDLLSNEVSQLSGTEANTYKQKIPFRVILNITGKLFKPIISFDIKLPEQTNKISGDMKTQIENKLLLMRQDPAVMNKQVFSLLLLNRFITEQSADFLKYSSSDFSDIAKKSVSNFLSGAINEIAGDIFKGIDVDLNLNSYNDYSKGNSEQRTDLNVAISKSFFNNRLTIAVGNNFGLAGTSSAGNNNTFRPDVNLSYKLSKDGKYMIKAYTKNQFEVVLDGYVVETGMSFVITVDYDIFKEFFGKKNKD